jgi:AcrR family transcriptional regulator
MAPREPSAATRRRILDVSLDLFLDQGYDRTSLREIAERLGFSKAALYYHYKAKDDILVALTDAMLDELDELVERVGREEPPGLARTRRTITELVDLLMRQRRAAQLIIAQASVVQRLKSSRNYETQHRLLGLITPSDAPLVARVRASAAVSVVQSMLLHLNEDDAETVRSTVLSLALRCLEPTAEPAEPPAVQPEPPEPPAVRSAERLGQA